MRSLLLNSHIGLAETPQGSFLYNRNDIFVGKALELYGEYNQFEATFLSQLIQPGYNIIEIGANIGAHTVGMAKKTGPTGTVFAFEPQRGCYAFLQAQIALNQLNNVYGFNEALGAEEGELWIPPQDYEKIGNFGAVELGKIGSAQHERVKVRRLDNVLGNTVTHLIKIDVEGMEYEVLLGANKTIQRDKPILYVENDRPEKSPALIKEIQSLGYRLWWHLPPLYNPNNTYQNPQSIYGEMASINMFCIHKTVAADLDEAGEILSPDVPHPCRKKD